jgi:hypothetical protein
VVNFQHLDGSSATAATAAAAAAVVTRAGDTAAIGAAGGCGSNAWLLLLLLHECKGSACKEADLAWDQPAPIRREQVPEIRMQISSS